MILNTPQTILGTEVEPKIQFFHEFLNAKSDAGEERFNPLHKQEYYELSFFVSGQRSIKVGETVYNFTGGDVFMVTPGVKHGGGSTCGTFDRYRMHIWPNAFDSHPNKQGMFDCFSKISEKGNKISFNKAEFELVYGYLTNIDANLNFGSPETRYILAFSEIIKLLALLRRIVFSESIYTTKNPLLLNILSYIASAYDTVTTTDIEKQFSISHSTLWRLFSKEMNMSPHEYILHIRLNKAILLLTQGIDVQTVSDLCGFCDCSYFIKKFKERYGLTPNQQRKNLPQ